MSFEMEPGESVRAGVRRIVDEQLATALDELRGANPRKSEEAVHSARKRLKRVRAVTRLVRDELGEEVFARDNAAFRDAGGTLSEARDAAVLVQTLDALKGDVADPAAFAAARKRLVARRRAITRRVLEQGNGLEGVAKAIDDARGRVTDWPIDRDGWRALRPGLRRIYANGRRGYELAELGAAPEVFHEWRKQVKNLWHQLEVLEPVWPAMMKRLADECHDLADALGHEHDLAVLCQVLPSALPAGAPDPTPVLEAARSARARCQREALSLGARLYAEKPGPFTRRLGKYWRAWRAQRATDVHEEADPSPAATHPDAPIRQGGGGGMEVAASSVPQTAATGPAPSGNGAS